MELYNDDCFNVFPKIEDKSVDLFVLDLPYANKKFGNCTACKWDTPIDLKEMWKEIKRIMKPNATIVHFCNTKFGFALIESNPKWFRYDLIWKKSRKVGFLSANKMPLRQHENIYIFNNDENEEYNDLDLVRNKELREYAEKVKKFINKPIKTINKDLGNMGIVHFYCFGSSQFGLPTKKTYNKLIELYNIDKMEGFKTYEEIKDLEEKAPPKQQSTYNSQKIEGKPYIVKEHNLNNLDVYNQKKVITTINKGDRHPTSIIDIEPDHENIYVFNNDENEEYKKTYYDLDLVRNKELREYSKKVYEYIGKSLKTINKELGHRKAEHFFYFKTTQFGLIPEKTYNELIEKYNIDKMEGFKTFEEMKDLKEKAPTTPKQQSTYNPQKTEGTPYKSKERIEGEGVYIKETYKRTATKDTTNRHPTSIIDIENTILEYKNPHKTIHRTQKPVDLLEWLIKTYSNENDTVMDFCMGSGTAGVACKNLNRKFIGVEKEKEMFEKAKDRILNS